MPRPSPIGVAVAEAVEVDVAGEEDPSDVEVDVVETESAAEVCGLRSGGKRSGRRFAVRGCQDGGHHSVR